MVLLACTKIADSMGGYIILLYIDYIINTDSFEKENKSIIINESLNNSLN